MYIGRHLNPDDRDFFETRRLVGSKETKVPCSVREIIQPTVFRSKPDIKIITSLSDRHFLEKSPQRRWDENNHKNNHKNSLSTSGSSRNVVLTKQEKEITLDKSKTEQQRSHNHDKEDTKVHTINRRNETIFKKRNQTREHAIKSDIGSKKASKIPKVVITTNKKVRYTNIESEHGIMPNEGTTRPIVYNSPEKKGLESKQQGSSKKNPATLWFHPMLC